MINIKNISFGYGKSKILNDISFTLEKGELCNILGVNGSGKTTLIRLIARALTPAEGLIELDGKNISSYAQKEYAQLLAWLPQTRDVPCVNAYDLIASGRFPYLPFSGKLSEADEKAIEKAISLTNTESLLDKDVRQISGGERQRVYFALMLAQDTPYILLDEPSAHLDVGTGIDIQQLIRNIKNSGKGVLSVCHELSDALKYSDKILLLDKGRVCFYGQPDEAVESGLIESAFGVRCIKLKNGEETEFIFKK